MHEEYEKTTGLWIFAVVLLSLFFAGIYGNFIAWRITQESEQHLQELYSRENQAFLDMIEKNEAMLRETAWFMEDLMDAGDSERLRTLISRSRENWGFSDFYFMDYAGNYITPEGEQGSFAFEPELQLLIRNGQSAVKNVQSGETARTIFAVPIIPNQYADFSYTAMAVGYDGEDMEALLDISAYRDRADCYVLYSDGRVLFSAKAEEAPPQNFLTFLEENAAFDMGSLRELESGLRGNENGVFRISMDSVKYYLVYQNVDYRDWTMVGLVPQEAVNGSMSQIQWITICMLGILFICIGAAVIFLFLRRSEHSLYRKDMELRSQKRMLEIVAGGVRDIFIVFSAEDWQVDYVSPNCETLLGIHPEEIQENIRRISITAVRPEEDLTREELEEIKVGEAKRLTRERIHQKTGGRRWFQETLYRRLVEETEKFVLILSERTIELNERRQLEQMLGTAQGAMEAKHSFLANISHDIRTPLQAILGFSEQLDEAVAEPQRAKELSRRIRAAGGHLQNMLNDILDISRLESGKAALTISEFEVQQLVEDIDAAIRAQIRTKRQFYDVRIRGTKGKRLIGDRVRIEQILLNMLSNAIQYTPEGGRIELNITQRNHASDQLVHLHFRVRDNGIGMEEEYQDTLFDIFTHEEDIAAGGRKGIGVGMAITKALVDLMGGTISVDSQKDFGTTVSVDLHLRVADSEKDWNFWKENHVTKLLSVDENVEVHRRIARAMEKTGVKVMGAAKGTTALQMIEDAKKEGEPYNLILMDWKLPGSNGPELAHRIRREIGEDIPLVMLTAYDWEDVEQAALEIGVDAFLTKPFFAANLRHLLRQIRHRHADEEISANGIGNALRGLRILGIEQEGRHAENFYEMLRAEGAECELAENEGAGLEKFLQSIPGYYDLILLELCHAGQNGVQTAEAIRASAHPEARHIPILALTAEEMAADASITAYLPQAADLEQTQKILAQLLDKKRF